MSATVTYHYDCDQCDHSEQTRKSQGLPGWVQLGISGSEEPGPLLCSWRCLITYALDQIGDSVPEEGFSDADDGTSVE